MYSGRTSAEPRVKSHILIYEPLEVTECEKCGKVKAEPKELIAIVREEKNNDET